MATKIAVLGNGPSLLCHQYGEQIDACDVVVRINRWEISPQFRAHVGRKVTIWAHYCKPFDVVKRAVLACGARAMWWVEIGDVKLVMAPWYAQWEPWCAEHCIELRRIPEATVARCYADLGITQEERDESDKKPTSGVVVLAHALETWPDAEVYAAGFDGYRDGEPSYYWSHGPVTEHETRKIALEKQRAWYAAQVRTGRVREFSDA